ncbi:MAG TPA: hypothetical protein DIW07_00265, partial [Lachnospiraceae bacterium]|nr:hypothetical protein [Lachnospiraceae bacterium]
DLSLAELRKIQGVKGIILNGGPNCIVEGKKIVAAPEIQSAGIPVLAVDCQGAEPWDDDAETRQAVLKDFVFNICKAEAHWTIENFISDNASSTFPSPTCPFISRSLSE